MGSEVNFVTQIVLLVYDFQGSYMDKDLLVAFYPSIGHFIQESESVECTVFHRDGLFYDVVIGIKYLFVTQ